MRCGVKSRLCEQQDTYFDFSFLELQRLSRVGQPGVDGAQLDQLKPPIIQNFYFCVTQQTCSAEFAEVSYVFLNVFKR